MIEQSLERSSLVNAERHTFEEEIARTVDAHSSLHLFGKLLVENGKARWLTHDETFVDRKIELVEEVRIMDERHLVDECLV